MGKGLNSFRIRFAVVTALMLLGLLGTEFVASHLIAEDNPLNRFIHPLLLALSCLGVAAMYLMTGKLTRPIEALRASTEAIARGDFETTVQVDCMCEVGGLADSFKVMVNRLNANVSKIQTLAYQDGITGLPNRSALNRVLPDLAFTTGAMLFIDLDKFKQVNDTLGHDMGDRLLAMVAERITDCLVAHNQNNLVFRFAGDEFVALIPDLTDSRALGEIASQINTSLANPFRLDDNLVQIGCSIGVARYPVDTFDIAEILTFADLAMYQAKRSGRGCTAFFDNRMRDEAIAKAKLENELRLALQRDELVVHFQPKVETGTRRLVGVEALVRWQHPERGLLMPGAFLDIAEGAGLVSEISRTVARISAQQSRRWRDAGHDIPIAINICPSQFINPEFADNVLAFVSQAGLRPDLIELELTETIAMLDIENAKRQITKLKSAGIGISIDDFGTGYSNLSQLYRLPFDTLKLDKSLIHLIGTDPQGEYILRSLIQMAHSLGHKMVAEGVETPEQLAFLDECGCDYVQGYLCGRPMPAAAFVQWLAASAKPAIALAS